MAGNQYITNRKALFDENDEDVDDDTFLKNSRPRPSPSIGMLVTLVQRFPKSSGRPLSTLPPLQDCPMPTSRTSPRRRRNDKP